MLNIAVFVSGGGTNLQAIIDARQSIIRHGEIALVVSNKPDAYALTRAADNGIKTEVVIKDSSFEDKLIALMDKYDIDIIVLAGFMCILTERFTSRFPSRIINVHPALIPSFCGKGYYGLRVHEAVLAKGVKVTGATVHFVNEIPDGGEIIEQKAVRVRRNDTPQTLQRRVMEKAEWIILPRAIEKVCAKTKKRIDKGEEK